LNGIKQAHHAILFSPAFKAQNCCNEIRPPAKQAEKIRVALVAGFNADTNNVFNIQCHFNPVNPVSFLASITTPMFKHSCV
jgi:hypothetical protein